ncbi:MAG: copper chaperone PCu(A)C [Anaerolineales bacterium]
MKRIFSILLVLLFLLSACGSKKGIETHNAWMRPAAKGENGSIYFELHNHGSEADELLSITTDVAQAAEIHESKMEGDVMKMDMLTSLPIKGFADVTFKPGGLHVMLVNVNKDFKLNDELEIVLHFKTHEDITVHVIVKDAAPEDEDHDM